LEPEEVVKIKKLFVNDLIAVLTGVEEEHVQWLLNHLEIKYKDEEQDGPVYDLGGNAVEIDEDGNEVVLENGGKQFGGKNDQKSKQISDATMSDSENGSDGADVSPDKRSISIFEKRAEDVIYFTEQQGRDLKAVLDTYTMMINIDIVSMRRKI
jgi:hypothetical protein